MLRGDKIKRTSSSNSERSESKLDRSLFIRLWVLENNHLLSRFILASRKVALFREKHDFSTRSVIRLWRTTISTIDERGRMFASARPRVRNCGLLTDRDCFRVSLFYLFSAVDRDMQTLEEENLLTSKVSYRKYGRCQMSSTHWWDSTLIWCV